MIERSADSFSRIYGRTKQVLNFFQQFLSLPPTQERNKERLIICFEETFSTRILVQMA